MGRMPYVFGASLPVTTHTTPSRARARLVSIFLMRACGYGECRILPISIPGTQRSSVYLPAPVVLPAASTMATGLPIMEKLAISNHVGTGAPARPVEQSSTLFFAGHRNESGIISLSQIGKAPIETAEG